MYGSELWADFIVLKQGLIAAVPLAIQQESMLAAKNTNTARP
jgi:hypothetical protein